MRQLLQDVNWKDTLNPLDIHSAWQFFASKFTDVVNRCIPLCINRKKKNIYVTCRVFSLRNRKHKLWNKYIRSKSDTDFQHYCKVRNELHNLTRTLRINYENKLVSNVKINPRQFWKYVNSQLKVHPKIDSLQCPDNTVSHLDSEKSEQLNKYFSSVFTREDSLDIPPFSLDADIGPLTDIEFTPCAVYTKLINLNPSKASDPEEWPILSLKECAQQLSIPLSILFSKSFNSSSLLTTWKEAFVTPIYKKVITHLLVTIDLLVLPHT